MEITDLVWRLFLILLPGIISTIVLRFITTNKSFPVFEFCVYSATLGIGNLMVMELLCSFYYVVYFFFGTIKLDWKLNLSIWGNIFDNKRTYNQLEFFFYYLLSVPSGFLWGYLLSKKVIVRLMHKIKLTQRFGDNDIFSFYLTSEDVDWLLVRDYKRNLTYFGKIRAYSDTNEKRELLLEDVTTYTTDTWKELYTSESVYLELSNFEFSIESPSKA